MFEISVKLKIDENKAKLGLYIEGTCQLLGRKLMKIKTSLHFK